MTRIVDPFGFNYDGKINKNVLLPVGSRNLRHGRAVTEEAGLDIWSAIPGIKRREQRRCILFPACQSEHERNDYLFGLAV
ncbi:hypothetical protein DPMN_112712 [Dreissena polymorpha]|uniref:Uncharacterized protein n=1 Tax=Dreissena polymorpha TaxID=45954 RepID=A0A9D4KGM2_DREPO|nr:hypothetical protein DPMN_112712 [Dreissena polymorpha]